MGDYLKLFETDNDRLTYEEGESYIEPYVSYVEGDNSVHYNKPKETRVVAVFNVTDTINPTNIMHPSGTSQFSEIEIDGVVQPTVVNIFTFDTLGEHTVKYTLSDPTSIGNTAFSYCVSLSSIIIPNSVTSIGDGAFGNCSGLTSVTISDTVTSIGISAFGSCNGLTSAVIGSGVTSIGNNAFAGCINLFTITSHIMNAPSVNAGTFASVKNGGTLYVPIGSSGYETWMNDQGNLGSYNWTKVEQ